MVTQQKIQHYLQKYLIDIYQIHQEHYLNGNQCRQKSYQKMKALITQVINNNTYIRLFMLYFFNILFLELNNWEKIYDLPAHCSTLTLQDYTSEKTGVNVKRQRNILEAKAKQYAKQPQSTLQKQQHKSHMKNLPIPPLLSPHFYQEKIYESYIKNAYANQENADQANSSSYYGTNKSYVAPPPLPPRYRRRHVGFFYFF